MLADMGVDDFAVRAPGGHAGFTEGMRGHLPAGDGARAHRDRGRRALPRGRRTATPRPHSCSPAEPLTEAKRLVVERLPHRSASRTAPFLGVSLRGLTDGRVGAGDGEGAAGGCGEDPPGAGARAGRVRAAAGGADRDGHRLGRERITPAAYLAYGGDEKELRPHVDDGVQGFPDARGDLGDRLTAATARVPPRPSRCWWSPTCRYSPPAKPRPCWRDSVAFGPALDSGYWMVGWRGPRRHVRLGGEWEGPPCWTTLRARRDGRPADRAARIERDLDNPANARALAEPPPAASSGPDPHGDGVYVIVPTLDEEAELPRSTTSTHSTSNWRCWWPTVAQATVRARSPGSGARSWCRTGSTEPRS